jgi:xanthine permease
MTNDKKSQSESEEAGPETVKADGGTGVASIKYKLDEKPPLLESIPFALQHVMFMIVINISLAIIIANGIGLGTSGVTYIVQMAFFVAGVGTIVQALSFGGDFGLPVGGKLPIVMGTSAAFIGPLIIISQEFGIAAAFGAVIVAAPVEIVLGYHIDKLESVFPPMLGGIVVTLIGLSLAPVAIDYFAGGAGASDYGGLHHLGLGLLVMAVALFFNQFFSGLMRSASVFFGLVAGYLAAIPLGLIDFTPVANAEWFALPELFPFGVSFDPVAILTLLFIYVIVMVETMGDVHGITEAEGREPTDSEMRGSLIADGVLSAFAGIFGMFPNTSFSGNVGIVKFTGVMSRYVVGLGGVFLILMGLVPKIGALFTVTPPAVLGGATIILFGMILALGVRIITKAIDLNLRNMIIVGMSLLVGLGVEIRPDAIGQLPQDVQTIFGSALAAGTLVAIVLHAVLPENPPFELWLGQSESEPTQAPSDD